MHFLEERAECGLTILDIAVRSVQDDYELRVKLILAPDWPTALPALSNALTLVKAVQEITTNYQNGPIIVVDK